MEKMTKVYGSLILNSFFLLLLMGQRVDSGSIVRHLPGFKGPLPFELETGYIGVGESEDVQLFYYFVKSERNPQEDPLLISLTGGPGCSSLTALFYELGPLAFKLEDYNGGVPPLISPAYAWTKFSSIIFLDQPVGAGFSYGRSALANIRSDTTTVEQIHEFLRKFLVDHPEFVSNPFYMFGDSYAGKIVPAVVQQISKGNEQGLKPLVNLQGYVVGNPVTDISYDLNYRVPFAHGMGLISDELYESLKKSCRGNYIAPRDPECLKFLQDYDKSLSRINREFILLPNCGISPKPLRSDSNHRRFLRGFIDANLSVPILDCYEYRRFLSIYWANDESVRKALNVVKGTVKEWLRCNWDIPYDHDIKSSIPYHANVSIKGYRSLVFSGDHDMVVPFLGTQAWVRTLNYSIVDKWRPWMINNQVAGYTKTYANKMTYATIKGCGHTPEYKPDESSVMFQRWINGNPL